MTNYNSLLNSEQLSAVKQTNGPLLVIAGAGSGKTRVITYRFIHMIEKGIAASSILAVTFTNKAANEMKQRIYETIGRRIRGLHVSTFHSFGLSILRENYKLAGLKRNFTIYDQSDVFSLIKELINESSNHDVENNNGNDTGKIVSIISLLKRGHIQVNDSEYYDLYNSYSDHLSSYNAVDFDDLIVKPIDIFENYPEILSRYQERFKYFMVDEFQDTSLIQYKLIKLLAQKEKNICAVGDDDQAIYSWRGAYQKNISLFEKDFPGVRLIKLEKNYRSTKTILSAANALIKNNSSRKEKNLYSTKTEDYPILLHFAENEREEASWIIDKIRSLSIRYSMKPKDFAVLVRTNNLTRNIEEACLKEGIAYKVSGGTSFFQRREVKDIIAYLKVIANPDDNANLLRIINTPKRGIGKRTVKFLTELAESNNCSIYSSIAMLKADMQKGEGKYNSESKAFNSLFDFVSLIDYYREGFLKGKEMWKQLQSLIENIQYYQYLVVDNKKPQIIKWKYENILNLVESIKDYEHDPDNLSPNLFDYLSRITLTTNDENDTRNENKISIMTIHAAKGLEFSAVFIAGLEEGILPHSRIDTDNIDNIEEERRLFYVAITRAESRLFLSSCRNRKKNGRLIAVSPSPFLNELPESLLEIEEQENEREVSPEDAGIYFEKLRKIVSNKN